MLGNCLRCLHPHQCGSLLHRRVPPRIGNDIDVILGTPWLASLGCLTWDFATMEFSYYRPGRLLHFTTARPRCSTPTVIALPPPTPLQRATREAAPSPPHEVTLRATRSRRPTAFDRIDDTAPVFAEMR